MIEELTTKLQSCYRARGWFDSAIDAKNDEIKIGRALHQTAQDRIRVLEADIAAIKEEATARLAMPVGEHIAHCMADRGSGPCEYVPPPDAPRIAALTLFAVLLMVPDLKNTAYSIRIRRASRRDVLGRNRRCGTKCPSVSRTGICNFSLYYNHLCR